MRVALFDVDGTLLHGQSYTHVLKELWRIGFRRGRIALLLAANLPRQLLRRLGLTDRLRNQERWSLALGGLFKGVPVTGVHAILRRCMANLPLRQSVMDEMARRRAEGCRIILASGSVHPVILEIMVAVRAEGACGTPLEARNGLYTGRLGGEPCRGARKLHYLEPWLDGEAVDWAASYAYSDGVPDLPMLERVGHPVAVDPEPALAQIATERGWTIISK